MSFYGTAFALVLFAGLWCTSCDACRVIRNKQLAGFDYYSDTSQTLWDCMLTCIAQAPKCKSGQWFSDTKHCYLKTKAADQGELQDFRTVGADGMTYFEPCIGRLARLRH